MSCQISISSPFQYSSHDRELQDELWPDLHPFDDSMLVCSPSDYDLSALEIVASGSLPEQPLYCSMLDAQLDTLQGDLAHKCARCNYVAKTSAELQEHGTQHNHKPFRCPESRCSKLFARHDCFSRHRTAHKEGTFVCPICFVRYKRKDNLEAHSKRKHGKKASSNEEPSIRQPSMAPSAMSDAQGALQSSDKLWYPEKSGLKCVAGTLRHIIVNDGGCLANAESMIDKLDTDSMRDLARKLAWTMISHLPTTSMLTAGAAE